MDVNDFEKKIRKKRILSVFFGLLPFCFGFFILLMALLYIFQAVILIFVGILFFIFGLFCIFYYTIKIIKLKEDEKYLKIKTDEIMNKNENF